MSDYEDGELDSFTEVCIEMFVKFIIYHYFNTIDVLLESIAKNERTRKGVE